ncbi:MAG: DUF899 family protein, partial [Hypericibacter sp.]
FYKDPSGTIFHTYSAYARGGDILLGAHHFLDMTPNGRNEAHGMDWVRHHDRYDAPPDATASNDSCCDAQTDPVSEMRRQLDKVG